MAEQNTEPKQVKQDDKKPNDRPLKATITKGLPWWVEASYTQDLCAH